MTIHTSQGSEPLRKEQTEAKVKDHMHWMLEASKGETVLDVGCTDGLLSVMLAREGKHVVGMDVEGRGIEAARKRAAKEEAPVKKHLEFIHDHFASYSFKRKFDVIILNESFKEVRDKDRYIEKAMKNLNPEGRLIITVPFGAGHAEEEEQTSYINDLFSFQKENLRLTDIQFFDGLAGAIYELDDQLLKGSYLEEKKEKVSVQKELYDQYVMEETLLRKYNNLDEQYKSLKRKYDSLSQSKLGKLTVKYWEWRRKRRN
jgi:2-polyprenyl-6-hydroxyphenyl methylase/3-demethylubiquinone-9 3-methyltransferase